MNENLKRRRNGKEATGLLRRGNINKISEEEREYNRDNMKSNIKQLDIEKAGTTCQQEAKKIE